MGMVIWFKRQDDRMAADDDRLLLYRQAETLDALADAAGVPRLSAFFDHSDVQANLSEEELNDEWAEEHETWHDASRLITTLEALRVRLADVNVTPSDNKLPRKAILEEIEGCLIKAKSARDDQAKVHLSVVM